jgi:energy-coupling factor transporter ATP-binding protein EcfA2
MSLLADILAWSQADLPAWQQDALRRLFQQDSDLDTNDYDELYALLKAGHDIVHEGTTKPLPLSNEHLPSTPTPGATVILKAMRDLQDVNRLVAGQSLAFSSKGITVIYGPNASGKSGYARVLKRACRARDDSEVVLPDACMPSPQTRIPSAAFEIEKSGLSDLVRWQEGVAPPDELSEIAVFDSRCARLYLTQEQDVAYLPYGLDIVEALAKQVLPELERRLELEIGTIPVDAKPFDHLLGDTVVGRLIAGLSTKSTTEEIDALATLSEDESARLKALRAVLEEPDPKSKSGDLASSSQRLKEQAGRIGEAQVLVDDAALQGLKLQHVTTADAVRAEALAADRLRAGESLLPGTGEVTWKTLFEAARRFSMEAAHPRCPFPHTAGGAVCPLCQQELSPDAAKRLSRFESYVQEDIAKQADTAREQLLLRQGELKDASLDLRLGPSLESELTSLDDSIPGAIRAFEQGLKDRRSALVEALQSGCWDDVPELPASPKPQLRHLAACLLWQARACDKAAREADREVLKTEFAELTARSELAASRESLCDLVVNMKRRHTLEKCRGQLKTRPISDKSRDLASAAVTEALRTALADEFSALGVGNVNLRLDGRIEKGRVKHRLILDLPTACKLADVLSEGEQRAIAIGSFMGELRLAGHDGGIVFDDPVSSLDHWRRQNVARRLVAEAEHRQVIVFTHDTSFLQQLRDEIEVSGVEHAIHSLEWLGERPGYIRVGLPWEHQGYMERVDALEKAQKQLEGIPWPQYPNSDQAAQMAQQYSRLRATIERVIQDLVFCGVIVRYSDWVRVGKLSGVVAFEMPESDEIRRLHKRCCGFTEAHDQSAQRNATIPTAKDLAADIKSLRDLIDVIKKKRKAAAGTTAS